jgi:hypothetical protein
VDSHPNPNLAVGPEVTGKANLRLNSGADSLQGGLEDDEEAVAFGSELSTRMVRPRGSEDVTVRLQQAGIRLTTYASKQPSRTLNVREEQRHRPPGQVVHTHHHWPDHRPSAT